MVKQLLRLAAAVSHRRRSGALQRRGGAGTGLADRRADEVPVPDEVVTDRRGGAWRAGSIRAASGRG
jgi:hypothetical protein